MASLDKVAEVFRQHNNFLLSTHVLPDGDGIGGELALAAYLNHIGKSVRIINHDPTPPKYKYLDPNNLIETYSKQIRVEKPDVVVLIDCGELSRIGDVRETFKGTSPGIFIIDHHIHEGIKEDEYFIDISASSIGEMLYRFLIHVDAKIDFEMAQALYVSILTDTSSFRYSRTTSLSHLIAASLIDMGVKPEETYQRVYANETIGKAKLLGEILSKIHIDGDGRLAWVFVSKEQRDRFQVSIDETSSFIDQVMIIGSVRLGILFREEDNGQIKISLRSKGDYDVYEVCQSFGGGGHAYAAGMSLDPPMDRVIEKVSIACRALLQGGI